MIQVPVVQAARVGIARTKSDRLEPGRAILYLETKQFWMARQTRMLHCEETLFRMTTRMGTTTREFPSGGSGFVERRTGNVGRHDGGGRSKATSRPDRFLRTRTRVVDSDCRRRSKTRPQTPSWLKRVLTRFVPCFSTLVPIHG